MAAPGATVQRAIDARLLKLQRQASFLPADMICRELIALSWIAMGEPEEPQERSPTPPPNGEEGPMT